MSLPAQVHACKKGEPKLSPNRAGRIRFSLSEIAVPVYLASPNASVVGADYLDLAIANTLECFHFDKFRSLEL